MTVAVALQLYGDEVSSRRQATSGDVERIRLRTLARSKLATLLLIQLTSADVVKWRDNRLKKVKPSTVVREMTLLRCAIGHALDGSGAVNVVAQVKRPHVNDRRERRLQAGEWQSLLDAVNETRTPLMRPLLILALETGMRRGELLAMEWKHVDLNRCTVLLPRTKNGHARTVPLSPMAVHILSKLPRTDAKCLPISANAVRLAFDRLRKRAGISDLRLHDLRHECVSRLAERRLSIPEVQMVSGHRDVSMLMRYTHLAVDDIVSKLRTVAS